MFNKLNKLYGKIITYMCNVWFQLIILIAVVWPFRDLSTPLRYLVVANSYFSLYVYIGVLW